MNHSEKHYIFFRSLNGSRDSEVCLRIEDTEFDENCLMNKHKFKSGKFAGSLRRRLMREHLGRKLLLQERWKNRNVKFYLHQKKIRG